jgi:large subunit ribosomal protein L23
MVNAIIRPIITEKSMIQATKGWYTFVVDIDCDKKRIAADVANLYKVKVLDVRTLTIHGKTRRIGRRMKTIQRENWKKAVVKLQEGQTIEAFNITSETPKK